MAEIHRYPDAQTVELRTLIAEQASLSPEQLIVTNGGDELLTLVSEAFLDTGDEIVTVTPTFSEYEFGATLMGATTVMVPLGEGYQYNVDAIISAVTDRTKLVCLCSPNNPTGTYLPKSELQRLLNELPRRVLVVYDAAYSHYATAEDYTNGLEFIRNGYPIIVLQTFSKIYGLAGIRVGFGAASEVLIHSILQVKEPFNVNALGQVVKLEYTESMSNFVLVKLGHEARRMYELLLTKGIIVRYGGIWGLTEHVRVTVGTEEENRMFIAALSEIILDVG